MLADQRTKGEEKGSGTPLRTTFSSQTGAQEDRGRGKKLIITSKNFGEPRKSR